MTRTHDDQSSAIGWTRARFALGLAQMGTAVIAVVLLFQLGVTPLSLTAVVIASALTSVSVMLFGSRRRRDPGDD